MGENPRCIDLTLTNRYRCFQNTNTVETGLSDFHNMVVTVLKTKYQKAGPTVINYRDIKNFSGNSFKQDLRDELGSIRSFAQNYDFFPKLFRQST